MIVTTNWERSNHQVTITKIRKLIFQPFFKSSRKKSDGDGTEDEHIDATPSKKSKSKCKSIPTVPVPNTFLAKQQGTSTKLGTSSELDTAPEYPLGNGTKQKSESKLLSYFSILDVHGLKPQTVQSSVPYIKDIAMENQYAFIILT